ncbi:MAG: hypothetical protein HC890_16440 [Chloroflexaceae bacterium]|nr:hypothetical protein [Chloroflexaceae bacterium]
MTPSDLANLLRERFGNSVAQKSPDVWQIETQGFRLLIVLSSDFSWLRLLLAIAPASQAAPYLEFLMEANFDRTQEVRYALNQGVLWAVFQHNLTSLTADDLDSAILRTLSLAKTGLNDSFNHLTEQRLRQIIQAAKQQGLTLKATLQNLTRLYEEGMLGDLEQSSDEKNQFLAAWEYQLQRLWPEVEA